MTDYEVDIKWIAMQDKDKLDYAVAHIAEEYNKTFDTVYKDMKKARNV